MKNFISLLIGALLMVGCTPDPPACNESSWTYLIDLQTPVPAGSLSIAYLDSYGNTVIDTTISDHWEINISPAYDQVNLGISIGPSQNYLDYVTGNLETDILIEILRDGEITKTTGTYQPFCQSTGSACAVNTVNTVTLSDYCN